MTERWTFHLEGLPCLDLANTVSWRRSAQPVDHLETYGSLVEWARQGGLLTVAEARRVDREAKRRPTAAARVLTRARALREALYRVFGGLADGTAPDAADLTLVDRELHDALGNLRLTRTREGHALAWPSGAVPLARPLWTAARSAADLLTTGNVARLKTCPSSRCGWVFLDASKSGTRRWCAMWACGSRAKARRYYARSRSARGRSRQIPHTRRAP